MAERPPIEPEVHEYRFHRLCCPHCNTVTGGVLPDGVPVAAFGPRLHAALSVLTGVSRLIDGGPRSGLKVTINREPLREKREGP